MPKRKEMAKQAFSKILKEVYKIVIHKGHLIAIKEGAL
jgi:hypothetical protein